MASILYRALRVANAFARFRMSLPNLTRGRDTRFSVLSFQRRLIEEMRKPLSFTGVLTGDAMTPTLNEGIGRTEQGDTLVIRKMVEGVQHWPNRVHVNDVVVIRDPNDVRRKYVRRVVALSGEEMVSEDKEEESFRVPAQHCWVVRDNANAEYAPDSTTFGPLTLSNILGRVMYAIRSATDHGRVLNSAYGMLEDSIVLASEPPPLDAPKS